MECASRKRMCFNLFPCAVSFVLEPTGWCKQGKSSNNPWLCCQDLGSTRHWAMYHFFWRLPDIYFIPSRRNSRGIIPSPCGGSLGPHFAEDEVLHANWEHSHPLGGLPCRVKASAEAPVSSTCQPSQEAITYHRFSVLSIQENQNFLKSKSNPAKVSLWWSIVLQIHTATYDLPGPFSSYLSCSVPSLAYPCSCCSNFLSPDLFCPTSHCLFVSRTFHRVLWDVGAVSSWSVCPIRLPVRFTDEAKHTTRMDHSTWPSSLMLPLFQMRWGSFRLVWP